MFPTFTGSSRKPRQVNLSGQAGDPFAAWGGGSALGTKNTVANAQKERAQRQAERDRLLAARRIQRVWRGHQSRRRTNAARREEWDALFQLDTNHEKERGDEATDIRRSDSQLLNLPQELRLLAAFYNYSVIDDVQRLSRLSRKLLSLYNIVDNVDSTSLSPWLPRMMHMTLASFDNVQYGQTRGEFLQLLVCIIDHHPHMLQHTAMSYYRSLSRLANAISSIDRNDYLHAIHSPLVLSVDNDHMRGLARKAQEAFALTFLTSQDTQHVVQQLEPEKYVQLSALCHDLASATDHIERLTPDERLWLLANIIALRQSQPMLDVGSSYITLLSLLLSSTADHLAGRLDNDDVEDDQPDITNQLPTFVKAQILALVRRDTVSDVLSQLNIHAVQTSPVDHRAGACNLLLLLLRVFTQRSEEIRMWVYQSSVPATSGMADQQPAVKLLWHLARNTHIFRITGQHKKSGLILLAPEVLRQPPMVAEWQVILLFLEVYAFALRFMDDEEFLGGGQEALISDQRSSRSRDSALPIQEVKALTAFLKELSFTMFFNVKEISTLSSASLLTNASIASLFDPSALTTSSHNSNASKKSSDNVDSSFANSDSSTTFVTNGDGPSKSSNSVDFFRKSGLTFLYLREIITRVMRMLYERDSRRRFLPKDHWLMTSRFDKSDMENWIPNVVEEEERRREIEEAGEDEDEEDTVDTLMFDRYSTSVGRARLRGHARDAFLAQQQSKARRRNLLATIGPRLEILQNMPFVIPFETRVQVFREFVHRDQTRRRGGSTDPDEWRFRQMHRANHDVGKHHATVRRDHLLKDAMKDFYPLGDGLKEPIQITFVDQFGAPEAGIDGGGVTKEFLTSIVRDVFKDDTTEPKTFVANEQNLFYPNPSALDVFRDRLKEQYRTNGWDESTFGAVVSHWLREYEFLGRIIGKCLYEGILVDITFAGFFLLKWSASTTSNGLANINDLHDLDPALQQGLLKLKTYPGDVQEFGQDFTITDVSWRDQPIERELLPNGKNIAVTNENRIQYISLVANHRLNRQPQIVTRHFLRGLGDIIAPRWLSMFNQTELQTLIGGDSSEIDVDDLRRNTIYSGIYQIGDDGLDHPTVAHFWQVMREMDDADRRKLLAYVTSTPRAPLLGFSALNPRFSIRDAGSDQQRLPSTSTCINLLKLPRYDDLQVMRQKLLYAINSNAGFDLS